MAPARLTAMFVLHGQPAQHVRPHMSLETMANAMTLVKLVISLTAAGCVQPVQQTAMFVLQHRPALHVRLPMSSEPMHSVIQVVT